MAKPPQDDDNIRNKPTIKNETKNANNNDVINAAFNPKSRARITSNITNKISAESNNSTNNTLSSALMKDGGRGNNNSSEEAAHPLLSLHQSVSTSNDDRKVMGNNGGSSADVDNNVKLHHSKHQQQQASANSDNKKVISDSNVTNQPFYKSTDEGTVTSNINSINPNKSTIDYTVKSEETIIAKGDRLEDEGSNEVMMPSIMKSSKSRSSSPRGIFYVLIKITIISILFILWISLMHATFIVDKDDTSRSSVIQESLPKVMNHLYVLLHTVQFGMLSFGQWIQQHVVKDYVSPSIVSLVDIVNMNKRRKVGMSIEQLEQHIQIGRNLLHKYNDVIGCQSTCTTVLHSILPGNDNDSSPSSSLLLKLISQQVSRILSTFNNDEINVLVSTLVCLGEVHLYLFSDTSPLLLGSSTSSPLTGVGSTTKRRQQLLLLARETYEVATLIDPTNPIVRSGLGLSYLLLGMIDVDDRGSSSYNEEMNNDSSMQYIVQSIQHLKTAVKLTEESDDDHYSIVRNGALHNLGLAYIALDGIGNNEQGVATTTYYKDWMESLHSSSSLAKEEGSIMMKSHVSTMNMGTMLLQLKRYTESISSLQSAASELCYGNDSLTHSVVVSSSLRQKEACYIALQNLAVAKDALYGHEEDDEGVYNVQFEGSVGGGISRSIIQDVAMWNANALVGTAPIEDDFGPDESADDDDDMVSYVSDSIDATEDSEEGQSEPLLVEDEVNDDELLVESNEKEVNEKVVVDDLLPPASTTKTPGGWGVNKPQMQNALEALENAVAAGEPGTSPPRTRMLLALAKARSISGNVSGAVDATLQAINAATTNEESEMSTLYLEIIMDKLASDDDDDGVTKKKKKKPQPHHVVSEEDEQSTTNNKDVTLLELEMKLELERLKYKVLEQDMKMQEMRMGSAYDGNNMRVAIEYQQHELDNRDAMHHHGRLDGKSITDVIEEERIILSKKTEKKPIEHEVMVVDNGIQEELTLVEETVSEPVVLQNETETEPTEGNVEVLPDSETIADIKPMSEADVEDEVIAVDETEGETESAEISQAVHEGDESPANATDIEDEEVPEVVEPIQLPDLFSPTLEPPSAIPPTAKSYMKMADAYLDKGQYPLASKQFLKVIKKAPNHLPAHLGYATALERAGKSKQMSTASLAYCNATKVAIIQGDKVDPMVKAGAGGLAENILRRAVAIAKSAPSGDKVETLQQLSKYAHTNALAADIYYEIGLEMVKQGIDEENKRDDAKQAFTIANEFVLMRNDSETPYHIKSVVEMGKISLDHESDAKRVIHMFNDVKNVHMEDDVHVELLVLVGRAYGSLGEVETAITEFTRALSFPQTSSTSSAHYELAIALKMNNGDDHEINQHFEQALDLGHDPTEEAIMALGERNMSVMRALNRQYYQSLNSNTERSGGGGIMSGGGVGSESSSVFAPQAKQEEAASAQSDTLSLLEQGAASYDGSSPMGGEVDGTESSLEHLKAKKESKESNLANLRR